MATLSRTCVTVQRVHLYSLINGELFIDLHLITLSFRKTYSLAVGRVNLVSVSKAENSHQEAITGGLVNNIDDLGAREKREDGSHRF